MGAPTLHHVGYAVTSIEEAIEGWRESFCALAVSPTFGDPVQRALVAFLTLGDSAAAQIELIQGDDEDSPIARFAAKGGGLHHLCFEVNNLADHLALMKSRGAMLIRPPRPAVAFDGRPIAWMVTRQKALVEYLQRQVR